MDRFRSWYSDAVRRFQRVDDHFTNEHLCMTCNLPCAQCVTFHGSSVDGRRCINNNDSQFNTKIDHKTKYCTLEASTQTELRASDLERTSFTQTCGFLPDLLAPSEIFTSKTLFQEKSDAPPPPPPPPPLPPSANKVSLVMSVKRKQERVKKSQPAGVPIVPEITAEVLKTVKLRKLEDVTNLSYSKKDQPSKVVGGGPQPAVTLEGLQRVTLRKTQSAKEFGSQRVKAETPEGHDSGSEDKGVQHFLRKTRLSRSPGGTPASRRRKPLTMEKPPVPVKQHRQAVSRQHEH